MPSSPTTTTTPQQPSIRRRAYRGATWTLAGEFCSNATRLVGNILLARMLAPEAFGLMALMGIVRRGMEMFADLGLGPNIIQNPRGEEPAFYNTAWSINIIKGGILASLTALAGFPMAWIYNEPRLLTLLPVFAIAVFIHSLASSNLYLMQRRMLLRTAAMFDLGRQLITVATMLIIAWFWPTVWALVLGAMVGAIFHTCVSFVLIAETQHRLAWDRAALRDLLTFGGWIFLATALTFMAGNLDRLMLGRFLGFELFGVFTIAYLMYEAPRGVITKVAYRVLLPAVAAHNSLPRPRIREKLHRNRPLILLPAALVIVLGIAIADVTILLLYDARYANAAWMLPILLLGLWPRMLSSTLSPVLLALGQPRYASLASGIKLVAVAVFLPLAYFNFGTPGAVIAIACLEVPHYLAILAGARRQGIATTLQDIQLTVCFALMLALMLALRYLVGHPLALPG